MTNPTTTRVIRTPDQRLRIFVSSTLQELAACARRACSALWIISSAELQAAMWQAFRRTYDQLLASAALALMLRPGTRPSPRARR